MPRKLQRPKPQAPLFKVLQILKKHRKKSSLFCFFWLLKWTVFQKPKPNFSKLDLPFFLQVSGNWDKNSYKLYAIYEGIRQEKGTLQALNVAYEIYRAAETHANAQYHKMLKKRFGEKIPPKYILSRAERLSRIRAQRQTKKKKHQKK